MYQVWVLVAPEESGRATRAMSSVSFGLLGQGVCAAPGETAMIGYIEESIARKMIKNHICGDCDADLVIAWGGYFGLDKYVIRCVKDVQHSTIKKIPSLEEIWESGVPLPIHTENRLEARYGKRKGRL